jgi:Zn-dependent peptidase ImmA (M78 family)/transcriptional regulator with XRE-family HTH domain
MSITQEELGRRLRTAREASRMTQDDVAVHLGVSRSTVAQIELGNRAVTGLEIGKLAYVFGRDIGEFLGERFEEEDVLVALFRLHPELSSQEEILDALRRCMALGRELTNLERLLGIDRDLATVASYPMQRPKTKWEAIQQGERVAVEERRRLGLGLASLSDVAELLEAQGIRTAQVTLPADVSGLTLIEPEIGFFVVANREHHVLRRRFSFAHEYCHVLVDRDRRGLVSCGQDRDELVEVRANAFAANFLMPIDAVIQFVRVLGKGHPSRMEAEVFDQSTPVAAKARSAPGSQDIQLYDVVQLAHHFGVSRATACYRLKSARLVTSAECDSLLERDQEGRGRELEQLLGLPEPDHRALRNEFRHRFLGLALEAFRRDEISRAKLVEVAAMVGAGEDDIERAIRDLGPDDGGADVRLPEE